METEEQPVRNRKRKNFFHVGPTQQHRNKFQIIRRTKDIQIFCDKIGLKIDEIILSRKHPDVNFDPDLIKITIREQNPIYQALKSKDQTNLSYKKYKILRKNLNKIIPSIEKVNRLQKKVNMVFEPKSNDYGVYLEPLTKIKFVCASFLKKNPDYEERSFKIKLACDGTNITKSNVKLLNFTFSLLNDADAMSVFGTYILGKIFSI